jgi:phosphoribosylaminoimidazole-succinocarboxamide synthase
MNLTKAQMLYEGKAKKIFATQDSSKLIQEFKDSLTAFNAQKKGSFEGKGEVNLKITSAIFKFLGQNKIPTHFIERLNDKDMLVEKLKMIPLEVVVRNVAAGSFTARLGVPEGRLLKKPLVEFYFKDDKLNDPLVTDDQILLLDIADENQIAELKKLALQINALLKSLFDRIGITLIDFKIEFGVNEKGQLILADEISPDSCRLWDKVTHEKLDKDRFRRDLGKVEESYKLVCKKIIDEFKSEEKSK